MAGEALALAHSLACASEAVGESEGVRVTLAEREALGLGVGEAVRGGERERLAVTVAVMVAVALAVPAAREGLGEELLEGQGEARREGEALPVGGALRVEAREALGQGEALGVRLPPALLLALGLREGVSEGEAEGEGEREPGCAPPAALGEGEGLALSEGVGRGEREGEALAVAVALTEGLALARAVRVALRAPVAEGVALVLASEGEGCGVLERDLVEVALGQGVREGESLALGLPDCEGEAVTEAEGVEERETVGEAVPVLETVPCAREALGLAVPVTVVRLPVPLGVPVALVLGLGLWLREAGALRVARASVRVGECEAEALRLLRGEALRVELPCVGVTEAEPVALAEGWAVALRLALALALGEGDRVPETEALALTLAALVGALALPLALVDTERVVEGEGEGELLARGEALARALALGLREATLPEGRALRVALRLAPPGGLRLGCGEALRHSVVLRVCVGLEVREAQGEAEGEALGERVALPLWLPLPLREGLRDCEGETEGLCEASALLLGRGDCVLAALMDRYVPAVVRLGEGETEAERVALEQALALRERRGERVWLTHTLLVRLPCRLLLPVRDTDDVREVLRVCVPETLFEGRAGEEEAVADWGVERGSQTSSSSSSSGSRKRGMAAAAGNAYAIEERLCCGRLQRGQRRLRCAGAKKVARKGTRQQYHCLPQRWVSAGVRWRASTRGAESVSKKKEKNNIRVEIGWLKQIARHQGMLPLHLFMTLLLCASAARPAPAPPPFAPALPCPYAADEAIARVNTAVAELLPAGRLEEGLACMLSALRHKPALPAEAREAIRGNIAVLREALGPWRPGARRLLHNLRGEGAGFPSPDLPLPPPPAADAAIFTADGFLSAAECADAVALFEASELFEGNVISAGRVLVDYNSKFRYEFDVSGPGDPAAPQPPAWLALERRMVSVLVAALHQYEARNPMLRTLKTPLGDEGFRMIRYTTDNSTQGHVQQHTFHVDGGQEGPGQRPRVLAALVYLNEVEQGGETLFYNQGIEVQPRCGRVTIFPSAFPYVHAGRRVRRGKKYTMTLMITL